MDLNQVPSVNSWECYLCANWTEVWSISLHIYILYFFTTLLIERIHLPGVVLNPGLHYWESTNVSTALQRLKEKVYLWIYILYFCTWLVLDRRNLAILQVRIPLFPLLSTPSRFQNCSAHLPRPWVWQISKSANCKLHLLTYLYMHSCSWLVSAIYGRHWRPLFCLWSHIPAHAPGDL